MRAPSDDPAFDDCLTALCLPACIGVVPTALSLVLRVLAENGVSEERRDSIRIVLAEALNNIAEHAYQGRQPGAFSLRIGRQDERIIADLADWGRAFPDDTPPDGDPPTPHAFAEGGYGWFLIRTLASDVTYHRDGGQNRLRLVFPS